MKQFTFKPRTSAFGAKSGEESAESGGERSVVNRIGGLEARSEQDQIESKRQQEKIQDLEAKLAQEHQKSELRQASFTETIKDLEAKLAQEHQESELRQASFTETITETIKDLVRKEELESKFNPVILATVQNAREQNISRNELETFVKVSGMHLTQSQRIAMDKANIESEIDIVKQYAGLYVEEFPSSVRDLLCNAVSENPGREDLQELLGQVSGE